MPMTAPAPHRPQTRPPAPPANGSADPDGPAGTNRLADEPLSRVERDGHWPASPTPVPEEHPPAGEDADGTMPEAAKLHWWSSPKTLLRYVLSLDDTPHAIALGVAVGMFWGLTPTVGVQMALIFGFYWLCRPLFRFNMKAAMVTVYISNPLTMLPIYWFDYRVGCLFLPGDLTKSELARVLEFDGFAQWWDTVKGLVLEVGWPMAIGAVLVGSVGAFVSYPGIRWSLARWHRTP